MSKCTWFINIDILSIYLVSLIRVDLYMYANVAENEMKWWCFRPLLCTLFRLNWAKQTPGANVADIALWVYMYFIKASVLWYMYIRFFSWYGNANVTDVDVMVLHVYYLAHPVVLTNQFPFDLHVLRSHE